MTAGSSEINDLAQLLDCVADVLWCTVCACMQTQAKQVRWAVWELLGGLQPSCMMRVPVLC
jgi:hypothetical protein